MNQGERNLPKKKRPGFELDNATSYRKEHEVNTKKGDF